MIVRAPRWKGTSLRRVMGALNCPGDPGCFGYVAPNSADYISSLQDELTALSQTDASTYALPSAAVPLSQSVSSWLNQNAGTALAVAGGFLALLMLAKAGR